MATYTDNYSLTKPTFAEVADIRTINGNMDTIDDIMHASQVSLADAYDQTATYNTGDVVMYEFLMYKCKEDNVTGNWDATKWERTTAAETGGGEVDFDLYGEASGNPASFADGSESALVECEVEFEPKQDLHGYDKPWAGGAGKNIFGYEESATDETATYRSNINQQLIISKVTENEIKCNYNNGNYAEGYLVISGIDGTLSYSVSYTIKEKTVTYNPDIIKDTANSDSTKLVLKVRGNNGTNVVGNTEYVTFTNIQVESGTSITSFEPYSNICPISGHSSVTINVSPTNDTSQGVDTTIQLGDTYYGGTLNVGKGEFTVNMLKIAMESLTWSYNSTYAFFSAPLNDIIVAYSEDEIISSIYQSIYGRTDANMADAPNGTINHYGTTLKVKDTRFTDAPSFTTAVTGEDLCYELATPITVQIPPTIINTLLGQNYISSDDTEDIDVVYTKSTAPIKPNPSGEADGYLSSIELSGEKFEIIKELPTFPTSDGDYKLKLSVSSGVPTLSWVSDT